MYFGVEKCKKDGFELILMNNGKFFIKNSVEESKQY
jgi:hypothetical protein